MHYVGQKCLYFMQSTKLTVLNMFSIPPLKRLPSVDLEHMNREQLVKIFKNFAMPMHKRPTHAHNTTCPDQSEQLPVSQRTIHLKRKPESNVEKLTDGCKRIKFASHREVELNPKHDGDSPMVIILLFFF